MEHLAKRTSPKPEPEFSRPNSPTRVSPASPAYGPHVANLIQLQRMAGNQATRSLIQRQPSSHVGAVSSGYSLRFEDGRWVAPGRAGFSRLLGGAVGEMVEEMVQAGNFDQMMLRHVAPELSGIDSQTRRWAAIKQRATERGTPALSTATGWGAGFSPGSIRRMHLRAADSAQNQIEAIEDTANELNVKAESFNAFVPRANGFFVSAGRLSAMQSLLGASDNGALASALEGGLADALAVAGRYQQAYEGGERARTTEQLELPPEDDTVEAAAANLQGSSSELNTAYRDFRINTLQGRIGTINEEGKADRDKLAEIEQVKSFVRNVGATVDFTMTAVRGAPAAVANVTQSMQSARAHVAALRNRRAILRGDRPRYNPTYATTDAEGNMVVRNVQTGMQRGAGEPEAIPPSEGVSLPSSVSDLLGGIADFAYASEVREINARLEQIKSRVAGVQGVIDATEFRTRIERYQNALNDFAVKANQLQQRIAQRRDAYRQLGVQLDRFAQVDAATRREGQGVARGEERYASVLTVASQVREVLALGRSARGGQPSSAEFYDWANGVVSRRVLDLTDGEVEAIRAIGSQLQRFEGAVEAAHDMFSSVDRAAAQLMGSPLLRGGPTPGSY